MHGRTRAAELGHDPVRIHHWVRNQTATSKLACSTVAEIRSWCRQLKILHTVEPSAGETPAATELWKRAVDSIRAYQFAQSALADASSPLPCGAG